MNLTNVLPQPRQIANSPESVRESLRSFIGNGYEIGSQSKESTSSK